MTTPVDLALASLVGFAGTVEVSGLIGPWTSYRLGGPADLRLEPTGVGDLALVSSAVEASQLPVLVVGRGSNMLVSDAGFRGIALRLGDGFRQIEFLEDGLLVAGAGVPLPTLAQRAAERGLGGLAFASAIPASVGGAIRMNAGAHGHEIGEFVTSIESWRVASARAERSTGREADFRYRGSSLPDDAVVVSATFQLAPQDPEDIRAAMEEAKSWRRATQPLNLPNGGSVFKNPPGDHAARLVETIVGKDRRVGGARVSDVHANFIVAEPDATADDVYRLIGQIQHEVAEATGITLEPEIKLIGFDGPPWEG